MTRPLPTEIIARAMKGDREAFRKVVESHQSFAYAVAYRIVGNKAEAEDITQEAFVKLWKNIAKYRQEIKLSTWLYKIVTNLCLDLLKSSRYRQGAVHGDLENAITIHSADRPDDRMDSREIMQQIMLATGELSPMQKTVFVLRDLEALSVEETCDILCLTPEAIKSNLFHARKNIAAKLKKIYSVRQNKKI